MRLADAAEALKAASRHAEAERCRALARSDEAADPESLQALVDALSGAPDVKKAEIGIAPQGVVQAQWRLSRGAVFVIDFTGAGAVRWARSSNAAEGRIAGEGPPEEALAALRASLAADRAPALERIGAGSGEAGQIKATGACAAFLAHAPLEMMLETLHRMGVHHTVRATPSGAHGRRRTYCEIFAYDEGRAGPARCYGATSRAREGIGATLARALATFLVHEPHAGQSYAGPERADEPRGEVSPLEHLLMQHRLETTLETVLALGARFALSALPRSAAKPRFHAAITVQEGGRDTGASVRTVAVYERSREAGSLKGAACDAVAEMLVEERGDYHALLG